MAITSGKARGQNKVPYTKIMFLKFTFTTCFVSFYFKFYTGPRTMNNFIFIYLEILFKKIKQLKYSKVECLKWNNLSFNMKLGKDHQKASQPPRRT